MQFSLYHKIQDVRENTCPILTKIQFYKTLDII